MAYGGVEEGGHASREVRPVAGDGLPERGALVVHTRSGVIARAVLGGTVRAQLLDSEALHSTPRAGAEARVEVGEGEWALAHAEADLVHGLVPEDGRVAGAAAAELRLDRPGQVRVVGGVGKSADVRRVHGPRHGDVRGHIRDRNPPDDGETGSEALCERDVRPSDAVRHGRQEGHIEATGHMPNRVRHGSVND